MGEAGQAGGGHVQSARAAVCCYSVAELERDVVVPLITAGEVPFRLDALQHVSRLNAPPSHPSSRWSRPRSLHLLLWQRLDALVSEPRVAAFDRVARLAREFEVDARTALLRLSMERQGMLVRPATNSAGGGAAAAAAGASANNAGDDGGAVEYGPGGEDADLMLSL